MSEQRCVCGRVPLPDGGSEYIDGVWHEPYFCHKLGRR